MKVKWTRTALDQLHRVHAYYARIDAGLAVRMFRALEQSPHRLSRFPASGRKGQVAGTLELVVPNLPFVIVYRLRDDNVEILRLFHAATDWRRDDSR